MGTNKVYRYEEDAVDLIQLLSIHMLMYISIIMYVAAEDTRQSENIKTVGPNLYVALAAVHFKNHTSSGGANKPGLRQLKEAVYVL